MWEYMKFNFKDKVVLVTGASRGLGKSIAEHFAKSGAQVLVNYSRSKIQAEAFVKDMNNNGYKLDLFCADVSKTKEVEKMIDDIIKKYKKIDILVNNAGIRKDGYLAMMSEADWDDVINTNLKGIYNTCKWASRMMIRERQGKIINITSISAYKGLAGQTNYSAAKGGIISFTKSLSRELAGYGINVNAVAPGFIDTDMVSSFDKKKADLINNIPLKRVGRPEDVAYSALFLASDFADYITGHTLVVDGGIN